MATAHHVGLGLDGSSHADLEPLGANDRSVAFRLARRRTAIVRLMRWALPAASLALIGGYVLAALETAGWGTGLPELSLRKILPEDLAMNNPRYDGYGDDGSSYTITARTARQDLSSLALIELDAIAGTVIQADKTRINITATRGTFDHERGFLELFEDIDVQSESGLTAQLTHATIATKESVLTSNEPVVVEFPTGSVRSKTMTMRQKVHEVTFADAVEARLVPPRSPGAGSASQPAKPAAVSSFFTASDAPIDIVADRLDVNDDVKRAVFRSNVRAVQGEAILSTPELEVFYEGGSIAGGVEKSSARTASAGTLRRIIAKGPVVMTRDSPDVVTCDGAEFDALGATAILTGNVVMSSGEDRRATSQRAELDQRADTALLTGNVIVVQGRNQLVGRRLYLDRANRRAELTAPPALGAGPGRVTAHLYQSEPTAVQRERVHVRGAEAGRTVEAGSFKTDPKAPVDVEADKLNVDDAARTAVFRGAVRAVQGDLTIASAELHVFYTGNGGLAAVTGPPGKEDKSSSPTEVTRIEARKDVVVTSKGGQTVTGDWADFDAKSNTVTVGGEVILAQGQNVVRGTRLVIDMTSGESTIDTAPAKAVALPSGGGWAAEKPSDGAAAPENRGRASAVFFRQKVKGDTGDAASSGAASPDAAADGGAAASAVDTGAAGN